MTITKRAKNAGLKNLIITIVFSLLLVGVQPFLWSWIQSSAEDLHNQRTITQQIANLKEQIAKIEEEQKLERTINEQVDVALIQENEISQAIERLEQTAQDLGLILTANNIETLSAGEGDNTAPLTITISVLGPIDKVVQYLESIEHFTEITRIQDFRLTPVPDTSLFQQATIPRYSFAANVVFLTLNTEEETATAASNRNRFVSNTTPPPAGGSGINTGTLVLIGSAVFLVVLLVIRFMQSKKKSS